MKIANAWLPALVSLLGGLLACGCSGHRSGLPTWLERIPENNTYVYAVGTCTGATTIEEARQRAIEHAVAELTERFGVSARTSYTAVQTERATQVRDEIQSTSGTVQIKDSIVQDSYFRHSPAGYDAFVLVRYPREEADREDARLRSKDATTLGAAAQRLHRGDAARADGNLAAAVAAYLSVGSLPDTSSAAIALRSQAAERLSAVAASLRLEVLSGDHESVRPFAKVPVTVCATADGVPVDGLPLRLEIDGGQVDIVPAHAVTGSDGTAMVNVQPLAGTGTLGVHIGLDLERLQPSGIRHPLSDDVEASLHALSAVGADLRLSIDSTPRPLHLAVLIDERDGANATRRSIVSAILSDRLRAAGFRVVSAQELGRTNLALLERAFDRQQFIALSPDVTGSVDIAVGGWCETRPGSENGGWATSAVADANITAVDLTRGESIATASIIGRAGFGEQEDRARAAALRSVAEEVAGALVPQLAAYIDATSGESVAAVNDRAR